MSDLNNLASISLMDLLIGSTTAYHHANLDVVSYKHSIVIITEEVGTLLEYLTCLRGCNLRVKQML